MEDQEMERFAMDNDFEGGQYIDGEYYYRNRKEKRRQTKDDSLYGVFVGSSSDDEDRRSGKRGRRGRRDLDDDLPKSAPTFVSGGTVGQLDPPPPDQPVRDADRDAPAQSNRGFSGLGFVNPPSSAGGGGEDTGAEEVVEEFLPTAFGRKLKEGAAARREREKEQKSRESERKPVPKRRSAGSEAIGVFEKHTKGIGMKILEKMGYKGGGLGKNQQGIVAPVEANLRPKNMGMGFKDYKENKSPAFENKEETKKKPLLSAPLAKPKEKLWSKKNHRTRKSEYITAEEVLKRMEEEVAEKTTPQMILDMRGPQVRVLPNLENLNAEDEARDEGVAMPELQHNVKLIVDMAEVTIQSLNRDLTRERETLVILYGEKERLQKEADRQKKQFDAMEDISRMLDKIKEQNSNGILTLDSLVRMFRFLKERYSEDYKLCNLSCIACSYAYPLLIRVFQGWDPLQNPSHGVELMLSWRDFLQGEVAYDYSDAVSPYAQLVSEVILPAVRISGTNSWQARDPEPMLKFIESWEKLLPPPVLQFILDHIVMPKLSKAVDSWDPRRETIPIHVWIHPWLPLLGQKLDALHKTICYKLGNVLHAWHASDESALAILSPWKDVFDSAIWNPLILKYIVPKLVNVLQEFQINPAAQKLDPFVWVTRWASVVPIQHMVAMLEVYFFSKWQQVLYHWLCSNPNFEEVTTWYLGWKGLFPAELLANERIREQLMAGLAMMDQAAGGLDVVQPGVRENVSYLRATEQRQFDAQQQQTAAGVTYGVGFGGVHRDTEATDMSLKEAIEAYAVDHGLTFVPKVGKMYNGLQIYGFGSVSICVDSLNHVVFALSKDGWSAVSLERLLEMHRGRR
ncbi:hypothetical protein QJS10_CPB15g01917 [Acorus calamus]|uniref:G-patch domain-containing protein n=1 Tax=Acorus calamus TaxID=4465 RepID=A0AAV9D4A8_ACOCL|nr:hypothetical protein QJS10_CPB15g01917 [Acorus calamus]